jgi:hypothetical protein
MIFIVVGRRIEVHALFKKKSTEIEIQVPANQDMSEKFRNFVISHKVKDEKLGYVKGDINEERLIKIRDKSIVHY